MRSDRDEERWRHMGADSEDGSTWRIGLVFFLGVFVFWSRYLVGLGLSGLETSREGRSGID